MDLWPLRGPDWSSELPVISGCLVGSPVCLRAVIVSSSLFIGSVGDPIFPKDEPALNAPGV